MPSHPLDGSPRIQGGEYQCEGEISGLGQIRIRKRHRRTAASETKPKVYIVALDPPGLGDGQFLHIADELIVKHATLGQYFPALRLNPARILKHVG